MKMYESTSTVAVMITERMMLITSADPRCRLNCVITLPCGVRMSPVRIGHDRSELHSRQLPSIDFIQSLTPDLVKRTLGVRAGQIKRLVVTPGETAGIDEVTIILTRVASQDTQVFAEKLQSLSNVNQVSIVTRRTAHRR